MNDTKQIQVKPQRRSRSSHEAIIKAAASMLKRGGRITVEGVAKESGTGKPTIYRWWSNKTALLIEVFDRETSDYLDIKEIGDTRAELEEWFDGVWRAWQSPVGGEAFRSILAEIQHDAEARNYFNKAFIPHRRDILLDVFRRAQARGELQGRDIDAIVDFCWGFNWYHLLTHTTPRKEALREVVTAVLGGRATLDYR